MVKKLKSNKLKKRKKNRADISPFPSPETFVDSYYNEACEAYKTNKPKYKKRRKMYKSPPKHTPLIELPVRRALRIKQSIDHSIKAHIDRLADYRHKSMSKSSNSPPVDRSPPCCSPMVPSSALDHYNKGKGSYHTPKRKSPVDVTRRQDTTNAHKKSKKRVKVKDHEISVIELDNIVCDKNDTALDYEVKTIVDSVKKFEKQRQVFLSSLENVRTQVLNFRVPPPVTLKENVNNELERTEIKHLNEKQQSRKPFSPDLLQKIDFHHDNRKVSSAVMPHRSTKKHLPKSSSNNSNKQAKLKLNSNIMDNLSRLLINTSQSPNTKNAQGLGLQPIQNGELNKRSVLPLQGGFMNIAQTFCSMATGF